MKIFNFFTKFFTKKAATTECCYLSCQDYELSDQPLIIPFSTSGWASELKFETKQFSKEELDALNAERRTPEGKAKLKKQYIEMWTNKLEKIKEELEKLDVEVKISLKYPKI